MKRRTLLTLAAATVLTENVQAQGDKQMFGLIGKILAVPGKRDELIGYLRAGSSEMPGCLSYIVAKDAADENAIWVTEAWDNAASHQNSLAIPAVRETIAKARPLIAGFDTIAKTVPVGGTGLKPA